MNYYYYTVYMANCEIKQRWMVVRSGGVMEMEGGREEREVGEVERAALSREEKIDFLILSCSTELI
jgi:hypothetical protein